MDDEYFLLLNKGKFGKLIQLSPLDSKEDEEKRNDLFYFEIKSFSEEEEILNEFLEDTPEWLKNIGNKEEQASHLKKQVWLKIFERYKLNISDDFEGAAVHFK